MITDKELDREILVVIDSAVHLDKVLARHLFLHLQSWYAGSDADFQSLARPSSSSQTYQDAPWRRSLMGHLRVVEIGVEHDDGVR